MSTCTGALPLQLYSIEKGQGQETARKRNILSLGVAALGSVPKTPNADLSAGWIRETCVGMSSPEASTGTAAVMTLRVTNTKSKVVIVHLKKGRQRRYLEVWIRRGGGGPWDIQDKVTNSTLKDLKSHRGKAAACGSPRTLTDFPGI